jgi:hypothetical protein
MVVDICFEGPSLPRTGGKPVFLLFFF